MVVFSTQCHNDLKKRKHRQNNYIGGEEEAKRPDRKIHYLAQVARERGK